MPTWTERGGGSGGIDYDIEPQYERALGGFHPAYFYDVTVLGHDGWEPSWTRMRTTWTERAASASSWTSVIPTSATWTERT